MVAHRCAPCCCSPNNKSRRTSLYLGCISAASRLDLGWISARSRLDLGWISAGSRLYLAQGANGAPELVNAETFEGRKPAVATYTGSGSSTDIVVASAQVPPP